MSLLTSRTTYKPFEYPWAYEAWANHEKMHWLADEVPMHKDVQDWSKRLTNEEKNLLTQIFRFFTQADINIADGYIHQFMPVFANRPEITMMLAGFAAREAIHIDAYSTLIDTIGMPDVEYSSFLSVAEMATKHNFLKNLPIASHSEYRDTTARNLAIYSAFSEGLQLFGSFAILMNFPRFGKMKGMGQIVAWSVRDEAHHCESMIRLFHTFIAENKSIWTDEFKATLYNACRYIVKMEDAFIDLCFNMGAVEGLTPAEVKEYIRYIADRRLLELGLKPNFGVKKNPLPWMEEILNTVEHSNFFETSGTEYAKGNTAGSWSDVF